MSARPAFAAKIGHPTKFPNLIGDQREPEGYGLRGDHQIQRADWLALAVQLGAGMRQRRDGLGLAPGPSVIDSPAERSV
jgi:hypothetical protein